jgi:hypothetical protein
MAVHMPSQVAGLSTSSWTPINRLQVYRRPHQELLRQPATTATGRRGRAP